MQQTRYAFSLPFVLLGERADQKCAVGICWSSFREWRCPFHGPSTDTPNALAQHPRPENIPAGERSYRSLISRISNTIDGQTRASRRHGGRLKTASLRAKRIPENRPLDIRSAQRTLS